MSEENGRHRKRRKDGNHRHIQRDPERNQRPQHIDGGVAAGDTEPRASDQLDFTSPRLPHGKAFMAKSVFANFASDREAQEAVDALKEAGFEHAGYNLVRLGPGERDESADRPQPQSLTGGEPESFQAFMQAADPKASGLDKGERELLPERYRVVVVLPDEEHRDEAQQILKEAGGDLG